MLFISSDNKNRAISWKNEVMKKINNLSLFTEMGTLVPDKKISSIGFRMFPVGNYIVFYVIFEQQEEVTILRILNAKRYYPCMFEKLLE